MYVFGGCSFPDILDMDKSEVVIGEKLSVRESKWRDVVSRSTNSHPAKRTMNMLLSVAKNSEKGLSSFGPAALLYE
jgi:hypothetical protein